MPLDPAEVEHLRSLCLAEQLDCYDDACFTEHALVDRLRWQREVKKALKVLLIPRMLAERGHGTFTAASGNELKVHKDGKGLERSPAAPTPTPAGGMP